MAVINKQMQVSQVQKIVKQQQLLEKHNFLWKDDVLWIPTRPEDSLSICEKLKCIWKTQSKF